MLVVDTNIIAPLYVRSATTVAMEKLRAFDPVWRTEPFALVEFSNVLASYVRGRYLTIAAAQDCLAQAESFLQPHYRTVPHDAALDLATRYAVTGYDARFLALAEHLGTRLVTEDAKLRKAAPGLTRSVAEVMASA